MSYQITMENKVAVVTGAAQGIGAAIAAKYAEAGAQVVILDVCPESCAAELLQGLSKYGKRRRTISVMSQTARQLQLYLQMWFTDLGVSIFW